MNKKKKEKHINKKIKTHNNNNNNYNEIKIDSCLNININKNISKGKWLNNKKCIEIISIKGNFWRIMGYTEHGINYLYPEEALYLLEKNLLGIFDEENKLYKKDVIYELIIQEITLECYLTYSKLKVFLYYFLYSF